MNRLADKSFLVTGAGSGLGEAIATLIAQHGARVVVTDIDKQDGQRVATHIAKQGGSAHFLPLDVCDDTAWPEVIDQAEELVGPLHGLVNNAGIAPPGGMDMPYAQWKQVMQVNLDGTFLGSQAIIAALRRSGVSGSVVNISSIMAMTAEATTAAYSASKGGVRSLTKAAALYCAKEKLPIRFNSVHPGMCITPLVQSYFEANPGAESAQIARYPIGHLGTPEDIAQGVIYLLSDEAAFVNGTELVIDGGYLAQ